MGSDPLFGTYWRFRFGAVFGWWRKVDGSREGVRMGSDPILTPSRIDYFAAEVLFLAFVARLRGALAGAGSLLAWRVTRRVENTRRPCSSKSMTVWCSFTSISVPSP